METGNAAESFFLGMNSDSLIAAVVALHVFIIVRRGKGTETCADRCFDEHEPAAAAAASWEAAGAPLGGGADACADVAASRTETSALDRVHRAETRFRRHVRGHVAFFPPPRPPPPSPSHVPPCLHAPQAILFWVGCARQAPRKHLKEG